jgi:hypothetical protein
MAEFHSFSGTDIHAIFGNNVFGELQMVSYKIDREKAPVYTMGSANLRTIARGKRLITGACVFVVFEQDTLLKAMLESSGQVALSIDETANIDDDGLLSDEGRAAAATGGTAGLTDTAVELNALTKNVDPRLADQILPFDITLVGANEYGSTSKMVIQGVELMSEAGGVSIDDLVLEKQISFIARAISNWTPVV